MYFEYNPFSLLFKDAELNKEYIKLLEKESHGEHQKTNFILFLCLALSGFVGYILSPSLGEIPNFISGSALAICYFSPCLILYAYIYRNLSAQKVIYSYAIYALIGGFLLGLSYAKSQIQNWPLLLLAAVFIIFSYYFLIQIRYYYAIFFGLIIALSFILSFYLTSPLEFFQKAEMTLYASYIFYILNVLGAFLAYQLGHGSMQNFTRQHILERQKQELDLEKNKTDILIQSILPKEIANKLIQTQGLRSEDFIAKEFPETTILFADLVGFTSLSEKIRADELVEMLNDIFSKFDNLMEKYNIEKIKTIGDCYMAASGVPNPDPEHQLKMCIVASKMLEIIKGEGHNLNVRIGIHSGSAVAGVIGNKKFIYDLWGDTVNTASRMESTSAAGKIQVTGALFHNLKDEFEFDYRGFVEIKGKKPMEAWFLGDRKNSIALG